MNDFAAYLHQYRSATGAEQARAAEAIVQHPDAVDELTARLGTDEKRSAAALLARCAKKESLRRQIAAVDADVFAALLADPDAKTRKNAAILLGALGEAGHVPLLTAALERETQQFVRPSIILALGALGGTQARQTIAALPLPEGDDRNIVAERDAIQKARSRLTPQQSRRFTGLDRAYTWALVPVNGLLSTLLDEARDAHMHIVPTPMNVLAVRTDAYESLFTLRGFYEILLPIAKNVPVTPPAFAQALAQVQAHALLTRMHEGDGPFALRLEVRGTAVDRGAFARAFFKEVPTEQFFNAPSSYDIELRAFVRNGKAMLCLKLHTVADPRFTYRLDTVPASMHPAAAAAVLYAHRNCLRPSHRVLDPFCGAGTLLIERGKRMGAQSLTGVDISASAWRIARANAHQAGLHAKVFNRDCRGFHSDVGFDEILCNMPFGHRVGSHESNEALYDAVLAQWPSLLRPGGFVLAITNEKALFRQRALSHGWHIERQTPFSAGGLSPTAFLCRR